MTNMRILGVLVWAGLSFVAADAQTSRMIAQPGAAILEPRTIGALGVEWRIQGDDNRNASSIGRSLERQVRRREANPFDCIGPKITTSASSPIPQ
jgi:hypothetical protein